MSERNLAASRLATKRRPQPIYVLMAEHGIENRVLADAVGVGASYMAAIATGRVRPSRRLKKALAMALGAIEEELFRDETDEVDE